jgi:hypothetical protein
MWHRWREMFTSQVNRTLPWDRWDLVAIIATVLIIVWVFALKLKAFYDLGYSGDLFESVQAARSWLEGKGVLQDNCVGNLLAIHTYFLFLPLGLIAKPFGAPGLLFVLAASVGAVYFSATRILRLLGVDGRVAVIAAAALLISPFSVAFYQAPGHGFQLELVAPSLCLILLYFLFKQRMIPSIVTALAVVSLKEDAPIAAAMVAIVAGVETWISSSGKPARCRFNWLAAMILILSVCAIPLLVAISWSQPPTIHARHSVERLGVLAARNLSGPAALLGFIASNLEHWLGSSVVRQWLWIMFVGTFGLILLRPYYLVIGLPTTVVAWLMNQNDLLWARRFFPTQVLIWCITLVGFASIARVVTSEQRGHRVALFATAIAIVTLSAFAQLALVHPVARGPYLLRSTTLYSRRERQQADALFARYRREGKSEEPVVASAGLFRYAHDRNLFWLNRLHGRPAPIWMLGDSADDYAPLRISSDTVNPMSGIHIEDYALIDRRGRFVLLKKK